MQDFDGGNPNLPRQTIGDGDDTRSNELWGSYHPGVVNFLIGDGAVRSIPTTIPTGSLFPQPADLGGNTAGVNTNSILARLGYVSDGNSVSIP